MNLVLVATLSGCGVLGRHLGDNDRKELSGALADAAGEQLFGSDDREGNTGRSGTTEPSGAGARGLRIQWGPDWAAPLSGHVTYRSLLNHWLYGAPVYEPSLALTPVLGALEGLPLVSRDVMARGIGPGVDPVLGAVGPGAWYFFLAGRGVLVGITTWRAFDPWGDSHAAPGPRHGAWGAPGSVYGGWSSFGWVANRTGYGTRSPAAFGPGISGLFLAWRLYLWSRWREPAGTVIRR